MLAEFPDSTGSLGTAISEAVEVAVTSTGRRYVLGSVLNQVVIHQSIIGLEAKAGYGKIRRISRHRNRLRRWRLESGGPDGTVYGGQIERQTFPLLHCGGAGVVPIHDERKNSPMISAIRER